MAVHAFRVGELLGRSVDKVNIGISTKLPPGPVVIATVATEGPCSREPSQKLEFISQDSKPDGHVHFPHDCLVFVGEANASADSKSEAAAASAPQLEPSVSKFASIPPAKITLESCPSFGEQRSEGSKPLWLERHQTLQRVHSSLFEVSTSEEGTSVVKEDTLDSGPSALWQQDSGSLQRYLPSWDIARSNLWLLVETSLLNAQKDAEFKSLATEMPAHTGTTAQAAAATTCSPPPQQQQHHHHQSNHHNHHHAPAPAHSPALPSVPEEGTPSSPPAEAASDPSPHQSGQTRSDSAPPSIPLGRLLRRVRSASRALLPTPLGLGPSSLVHSPITCSRRSSRSRPSEIPDAGEGAEGSTGSGGGVGSTAPCPKRHAAAFAAGLAAATSTSAVVSTAASVAASGLAMAVSSAAVPLTASSVLQLGSRALAAGANVLSDKVQSHISKRATAVVADFILGPDADPSHRETLLARVQATLAGASVAWFLVNLHGMSGALAHLDFEHDFAASAKLVLDLVTSGPSLMENCKDLMQIGVAVSLGVAQRNAAAAAAAAVGTSAVGAAAAAAGEGAGRVLAHTLSDMGSSLYSELGGSLYGELGNA